MSSKDVFSTLISHNKGPAVEKIIEQILISQMIPSSFWLNEPNIKNLGKKNRYYQTLYLFCYGTWNDYLNNKDKYILLDEPKIQQLKLLTLIEISKNRKELSYSELKLLLDIKENFQLEKILFTAFNKGFLTGNVDGEKEIIHIISVCPRQNLKETKLVKNQIEQWIRNLENSETFIDDKCRELSK